MHWLWAGLELPTTPAAGSQKQGRNAEKPFSEVISNPVAIGTYGNPDGGHMPVQSQSVGDEAIHKGDRSQDDHGVIYEDVPMEPSAPKMEYSHGQHNENDNANVKVPNQAAPRVVEENEYLNPV